eukprot:scaffold96292_cov23-Tisochrysis_lutea.AAC.3
MPDQKAANADHLVDIGGELTVGRRVCTLTGRACWPRRGLQGQYHTSVRGCVRWRAGAAWEGPR